MIRSVMAKDSAMPRRASTPIAVDRISFDAFELHLATGELRRRGRIVRLAPQPTRILAILISRNSHLVSREEIMAEVWGKDVFVDFEHGLNFCIRQIRNALGDEADHPRFIETVPRRGYRFIAPLKEEIDAAVTRDLPAHSKLKLAVLPFTNIGSDPEQEYFSDGLTEELIVELSRLDPHRVGVIARMSVMKYRHTTPTVDRVLKELGADYILVGSVRRSGSRVRITTQLIETREGTHLGAEIYERELADIFSVQSDVARHVSRWLALELLPQKKRQNVDPVAYEAYLKGRYHWNRMTEEGVRKSIAYYEQALSLDPEYALVHAGLADAYIQLGSNRVVVMTPAHAMKKAKAYVDKALALDSSLAEAHCALAMIHFWYDWDWSGALQEFERSISLNPNYATAIQWYALALSALGRHDEAFEQILRARDIDPLSVIVNSYVGAMLFNAAQGEASVKHLLQTLEMDDSFHRTHFFLGLAYSSLGRYSEGIEALRKAERMTGMSPEASTFIGYAYGMAGQHAEARAVLRQLEKISEGKYVQPAFFGIVHVGLGELEKAFAYFDKAVDERSSQLALARVHPAFWCLAGDRRYADLLRKLGLPPLAPLKHAQGGYSD
jgi:TolB-like protein/tetratricopeptide (TPR) repeat protein